MRAREAEFEALGIQIAVVTFEAPRIAVDYVRETGLRWPLFVDRDRATYHAYHMGRGGFWHTWGPPAWKAYMPHLLAGRTPRLPTDDTLQLGGDVLIDPSGIVRFHHVGRGSAGRPSPDTLLAVCRVAQ